MTSDDRRNDASLGSRSRSGHDEDAERADELRYDGPITIEEEEDDGGGGGPVGGGRSFITAALIFGAVVIVVAAAFILRGSDAPTGNDPWEAEATREPLAADVTETPTRIPPRESAPPATPSTARSIDYRAMPGSVPDDAPLDPAPSDTTGLARASEAPATTPDIERPAPAPARETRGTESAPPARAAMDAAGDERRAMREAALAGRAAEAARHGATLASSGALAPWTLQVVLACEPTTVERAFVAVPDPDLVVTPTTYGGRACYRVTWGAFRSRDAAADARSQVPEYFRASGKAQPVAMDTILSR